LDNYITPLHSKTRLFEVCEIIERNELVLETPKSKDHTSNSSKMGKEISAKDISKFGEKQKQTTSKKLLYGTWT
jgi:hypothetical protein